MTNTDWMAEFERLLSNYAITFGAEGIKAQSRPITPEGLAAMDAARCALLHHTSMRPAEGWMPIESAPKDGTRILMCFPDQGGVMFVAWWSRVREYWLCTGATPVLGTTGAVWQNLPAAPGAAPSLPEDQPSGRTYKDVDELFSAMGIPPSSGGSDEQIARRLVAWDDSGNTQGEHHETLREIINSARAALQAPSPEAGESEPTPREQTLAGLLKRCARCLPPEHATRKLATDYLRQEGFFNPLRAPAQPQPSGDRQEGGQA